MKVDSRTNVNETAPAASRAESDPERECADEELETPSKGQEALQEEVENLRVSLENTSRKHEEELSALKQELQEAQDGKEHAENQYRNLLVQVNTIKSKLGERLKADAVSHVLKSQCFRS